MKQKGNFIMLCLIGNAPSSGSTLLADLLDSTRFTASGPELEFFCNKFLYEFNKYRKNVHQTSYLANLRATGVFPRYERLPAFGLDKKELIGMIKRSSDLVDFFNRFAAHFLKFRHKDINGIVFEKTPQNINCIREYIEKYQKGYFVIITRNPIFVYNSLLKRNWGNYTALCTWFVASSMVINYINHDRIIWVRYEKLVENPFKEVALILRKIVSDSISPSEIENYYKNNDYRQKYSKGINSWEVQDKKKITNANNKIIYPKIKHEFSKLLNLKISHDFATHYNIPEVSFIEVLKSLGYYDQIMEILTGIETQKETPIISRNDYRKLIAKWMRELKNGHSNIGDVKIFFNVVEPIERIL